MNKKLILGGITIVLGASSLGLVMGKEEKVPIVYSKIEWEKPKTDAEWAEDVKAESFDIKSTGKLEEMKTAHTEKLDRVIKGKAKELSCPECMRFEIKQNNPEWTTEEIEAEYLDQYNQALWEIEKLQQSVERMEKELELRDKGFVVVEGESLKLGGESNKIIRKIND